MTTKQLHDTVIGDYGTRGCWVSDLALDLNIGYSQANYLTQSLGYVRGRRMVVIPESVFSADPMIQRIAASIK